MMAQLMTTNMPSKSTPLFDLEIELQFLDTNDGGRLSSVQTGYSPTYHADGLPNDWSLRHDWSLRLQFIGQEWVSPGGSIRAYGTFLCREALNQIDTASPFGLREGQKVIAHGIVISHS